LIGIDEPEEKSTKANETPVMAGMVKALAAAMQQTITLSRGDTL
jgi:hypothetical protein